MYNLFIKTNTDKTSEERGKKMKKIISLVLALVIVASTLYIPILVGDAVDVIIDKGNVDFEILLSYSAP